MEADNDLTATPIDFPRDNIKDSERKVDPAVYTAARIFNAVAAPPDMPDYMQIAAEARAEQAKISAQEAGFIAADTGGLTDGKTIQERERDKDEDARQYALSVIAQIEERREREREQEWDRSRVTIGTIAMSGEEWDQALEFLSDPQRRDRLIQNMTRKKGWTHDRAEKAADDALTLAQIAQRKKDGTITAADQTKADDITRRNPDAAEMVKEAAKQGHDRGLGVDAGNSASARSYLSGDLEIAATERKNVVNATTNNMQANQGAAFLSAPTLAVHFDAARSAANSRPAEPPKPLPAQLVASLSMDSPF